MKCVHSSEVCVMKVKTLDSFSSHTLKSSVKRATKKRATCFATLPQNELKRDVACFSTLSCCKTRSNDGDKTRNVATQLVFQQ